MNERRKTEAGYEAGDSVKDAKNVPHCGFCFLGLQTVSGEL